MPGKGGVTAIGKVVFEEDPVVMLRIYNALADAAVRMMGANRERFFAYLNTGRREVLRLVPEKYVTADTGKFVAMMS